MSKMLEMKEKFPNTQFWVDSCSKKDLEYGISIGAVGATSNPVIVTQVMEKELPDWEDTIRALYAENRTATEDEIAWLLIEEFGIRGAGMLRPVFEASGGKCGKISMQTNIKYYHDWEKMADQATHFNSLAPNVQVKMPISAAGLKAFEEATYRGVSVNATVSFSVSQAVKLAEAVERGLKRREAEGLDNSNVTPVCTIMIGRIDDWLKKHVARENLAVDPDALEWGGVAVFKNAYKIFKERGYRTRLLTAAYRNLHHWYEFIGGDMSMTITAPWLKVFDNSNVEIRSNMERPVPAHLLEELLKLKQFRLAYEEGAMEPEQFEYYGAFINTLEGFFKGYETLVGVIRPYQFGSALK